MAHRLALTLHPESLAICRLDPAEPPPDWALTQPFWSICLRRSEAHPSPRWKPRGIG